MPELSNIKINNTTKKVLKNMGASTILRGYHILGIAIKIMLENDKCSTMKIYEQIANKSSSTTSAVEKAITNLRLSIRTNKEITRNIVNTEFLEIVKEKVESILENQLYMEQSKNGEL